MTEIINLVWAKSIPTKSQRTIQRINSPTMQ